MAIPKVSVGKYRAIMTTEDRKRIAREKDTTEAKRYQAISRVRKRVEELETDVEVLEEHHPELLEELRGVVCEDE